ncbi:MAG: glycosyltransferase family 39 protein [Tepidisphaeraceae bacterium]|jgi:hypothetical protein
MILIAIVAFGAVVRFAHIGTNSLEVDEIWSIEMANGRGSVHDHLPDGIIRFDQLDLTNLTNAAPWWQIWTHMDGYPHPPIYYLALRWWMDLFGPGPGATRSLSAVISLLAIFVFFDVCRILHGTRIALLAAGLMAFSGAQIDFAQLTRNYGMMMLVGLGCADALVRIERLGATKRRLISLVLLLTALPLTHYYSIGAIGALAIYTIFRLHGKTRKHTMAAFIFAGLLAAVVWGPEYLSQVRTLPSTNPPYIQDNAPGIVGRTFWRVINAPLQLLTGDVLAYFLPTAVEVLFAIVIIVVPIFRLRRRRDLLLWVLWILGTLGVSAGEDLIHQWKTSEVIRFIFLAAPAVYALLASIDWPRRRIIRDALPLAALIVLLLIDIQRLQNGTAPKQDIQQNASILNSDAKPNDLLVFIGNDPWSSPGMVYMDFKYYAPDSRRPWLILQQPADPALQRQLDSFDSMWVFAGDANIISQYLPGWKISEVVHTRICDIDHLVRSPPN